MGVTFNQAGAQPSTVTSRLQVFSLERKEIWLVRFIVAQKYCFDKQNFIYLERDALISNDPANPENNN